MARVKLTGTIPGGSRFLEAKAPLNDKTRRVLAVAENRFITLTTDFGTSDHFVGTMKGVIYSINPAAVVVDVTHGVQSYDLLDGALTIAHAYKYFPANTIHVVVVDPGVGSERRPILVRTDKYMFIAPDNGVLSLVYEREEQHSVRHITAQHYFLQPVSQTFHGRDIFAAVAGWLSKGIEKSNFGEEITDYIRLAVPKPKRTDDQRIQGVILKVDKFGNLITNITPEEAPQLLEIGAAGLKITVGKHEVARVHTAYAHGAPAEVFGILGSMGYLEIATNHGAAATALEAGKGTEVVVEVRSGK